MKKINGKEDFIHERIKAKILSLINALERLSKHLNYMCKQYVETKEILRENEYNKMHVSYD